MSKRKTHEQFIEEMKLKNPSIDILSKYVKNDEKIKCKCLIDGHIWEVVPRNLITGNGCPKCSVINRGLKKRKTHEEFVKEMKQKNPKIEILGTYIKNDIKIKCKCLIDGNTWYVTPANLITGNGCNKCADINRVNKKRKSHEQYIKEMKLKNPDIEILGTYINAYTKIKCKNLMCGHIWEVNPRSLLKGHSCPICNFSKGEQIIDKYCKNNYFKYKSQYKIDNCRYKNPLPFDFALFDKEKLIALIEYQGRQHYMFIEHFGGQLGFENRKKRDEIKRNYCISNDIPLIEIPYWVDDIEGYLEEQMDKVINKPLQLSLI